MYHNVAIYVAKRRFFQRGKKRAGGTVEWTARPCWDCWDCWDWEYLQTSVDMKKKVGLGGLSTKAQFFFKHL